MKKEQSAFGWITAFAVLGNIRRQGLAKLARMPLGDVQAKGSATLLSVLPIGGLLLKSGTLTPEKFVLIVILSMGLITPIIGCMKFTDDLAKVGTIIGQVTDILTAQELPRPETDAETPQGSTVALHDVHFGYGDTEVLHGIDLTFREGTVNALVGPSGGGKTTLCHLLSRFWDVDSGQITLGGHDVREYDMDSLMRNFSFVFQNVYLFHDTVAQRGTHDQLLAQDGIYRRFIRGREQTVGWKL